MRTAIEESCAELGGHGSSLLGVVSHRGERGPCMKAAVGPEGAAVCPLQAGQQGDLSRHAHDCRSGVNNSLLVIKCLEQFIL